MKGRHSKGSGNRRNKGQKGSHWQRSETATWANERQYDTWAGPQQVNVGGSQVSPYGDYGGWFYHGQPDQYNQYHHGYQSPEWHPGFGSIAAGCPTLSPCWSHLYQAPQIATFAGFPSEAGSSSSSQAFQTRPLSGFDSPAQPPWPSFLQIAEEPRHVLLFRHHGRDLVDQDKHQDRHRASRPWSCTMFRRVLTPSKC